MVAVAPQPDRRRYAQKIEVRRVGPQVTVLLDGTELPAMLGQDPVEVTVDSQGVSKIRLTLLAERIALDDDAAIPAASDKFAGRNQKPWQQRGHA